ncbi:MAG: DUF2442 domain-containing protein [Zavarzinia sp.]|nr:DUF2442 domain-containing protein [Zavarzinia sp.]
MSGSVSPNADDVIRVGVSLPRISAVFPLDGRKVKIVWRDGRAKTVDLAPALESRRVFIPLRKDDALFHTLRVNEDGNAIEWDNGLDFSAVWLDRLPPVDFDNAAFRNAMDSLGMTLDGMALALGISRRIVAELRKSKPVPRHIALATRYLLEHRNAEDERIL